MSGFEEVTIGDARLILGDCREVLPTLAPVSAVVTDPPYGMSFMGRHWDYDVPPTDLWALVLDRLLPGGHLLAFAGTRTQHRMAVRIEDAGFEIRDMLAWVYGSGFPKSLDVGKAIDKAAGVEREIIGQRTKAGMASSNTFAQDAWTQANRGAIQIDITAPATEAARQWQGWGTALKPAFEPITLARKPLVGTVAQNVLQYQTGALNINECRVVSSTGQRPNEDEPWASVPSLCASCAATAEASGKPTAPATRASTATKPAEPSLSGRGEISPFDTSKADTGCFDGTRAGSSAISSSIDGSGKLLTAPSLTATTSTTSTATRRTTGSTTCNACGASITPSDIASITPERPNLQIDASKPAPTAPVGRWPSNFLHDGSDEVVALFPQSISTGTAGTGKSGTYGAFERKETGQPVGFLDNGSAARFFYCAKAAASERGAGNDHPTVKPLALMRWLLTLVTPPGGVVLDPFLGSGSTGVAAADLGVRFVGIERERRYFNIACERISRAQAQGQLLPHDDAPALAQECLL